MGTQQASRWRRPYTDSAKILLIPTPARSPHLKLWGIWSIIYYENQYEDTVMGTGNTAGSDARCRGLGNPFERTKNALQCTFAMRFLV